jgi:hypothetical protein
METTLSLFHYAKKLFEDREKEINHGYLKEQVQLMGISVETPEN